MGRTISYILQCMHITDEPIGIPEICTHESEKEFNNCRKPHKLYIPVNEFTINSLPEELRDEDMFHLVNILSNLTVQITSPWKSPQTNSTEPESIKNKILNSLKNMFRLLNITLYQRNKNLRNVEQTETKTTKRLKAVQYGSGRVAGISKATEKDSLITCPCDKCEDNVNRSKDIWIVLVFTATHVVPDTASAKQTECKLFYDTEETKEDMQETIYGTNVHWNHKKGDLCLLYCVTCNSELVNKLQKYFKEFNTAWKNLRSRADNLDCRKLLLTNRPLVIVSHPHGKAKQISFGQIEKLYPAPKQGTKELQLKREYQLKYKACTCPGSSGAPVYVLGINYFKIEFVHSGASDPKKSRAEDENFNYSTKWYLENRDLQEG